MSNEVSRTSKELAVQLPYARLLADGRRSLSAEDWTFISEQWRSMQVQIEQLERKLDAQSIVTSSWKQTAYEIADATAVSAHEPPAVQEINSLSSMTILRICTAYESGYGRGQSKRDLAQPYAAGCPEAIAYYEGWVSGVRRAAQPPGVSAPACSTCGAEPCECHKRRAARVAAERDMKDGARYRYLRTSRLLPDVLGHELDAAVDAAIAACSTATKCESRS